MRLQCRRGTGKEESSCMDCCIVKEKVEETRGNGRIRERYKMDKGK
jgi:hypothetical protein